VCAVPLQAVARLSAPWDLLASAAPLQARPNLNTSLRHVLLSMLLPLLLLPLPAEVPCGYWQGREGATAQGLLCAAAAAVVLSVSHGPTH